jgi:hypothetical protein
MQGAGFTKENQPSLTADGWSFIAGSPGYAGEDVVAWTEAESPGYADFTCSARQVAGGGWPKSTWLTWIEDVGECVCCNGLSTTCIEAIQEWEAGEPKEYFRNNDGRCNLGEDAWVDCIAAASGSGESPDGIFGTCGADGKNYKNICFLQACAPQPQVMNGYGPCQATTTGLPVTSDQQASLNGEFDFDMAMRSILQEAGMDSTAVDSLMQFIGPLEDELEAAVLTVDGAVDMTKLFDNAAFIGVLETHEVAVETITAITNAAASFALDQSISGSGTPYLPTSLNNSLVSLGTCRLLQEMPQHSWPRSRKEKNKRKPVAAATIGQAV